MEITFFGIKDTNKTELDSLRFDLVVGDVTPPELSLSTPDGTTGVDVSTTIVIASDEPLDDSSVSTANIKINNSTNFSIELSSDKQTITLTPDDNLPGLTDNTVTVKSSGIKDIAGNYAAGNSWSFRTAADPAVAPQIESKEPAANASNVAVSESVVVVISKPLDIDYFNSSSVITLKKGSAIVPVNITALNASNGKGSITINPTDLLDNSTTYTVSISGLKDTTGNPFLLPAGLSPPWPE